MRQSACKQINDMFGLNISVDFRQDYKEIVEDVTDEVLGQDNSNKNTGKGGDSNE